MQEMAAAKQLVEVKRLEKRREMIKFRRASFF